MTREKIIEILRNEKEFLKEKYGVLSIGIFGSYARNDQQSGSDIDLLVELAKPSFESLAGVQIHLEGKLGKRVDLIRKRKNMNERFLRRIEKDIRYV